MPKQRSLSSSSVISGAEVTAAFPNSFSSFWLALKAFCDLLKERLDGGIGVFPK